ncbi:MAG TPA: hypothetical protein VF395_19460 [Polyangiaceae bacterium]
MKGEGHLRETFAEYQRRSIHGTANEKAVVAAEAATEQRVVTSQTYSASTSRHGAAAAAGVGAGVVLTAAGAALAESAPSDDRPRAGGQSTTSPGGWRLVRPAESASRSGDPE